MTKPMDANCEIAHNLEVARGIWRLGLKLPSGAEAPQPGTFAMLRLPANSGVFLRRPFTYFDYNNSVAEFLYQVVGKGTAAMAKLGKGGKVGLLGPLGKPFPMPEKKTQRV